MSPDQFLNAARVPDSLKSQEFGHWTIERINADETILGQLGLLGWPTMTMLCRHTWATLHKDRGEVVMEDSRRELSRHLPIWLCARGPRVPAGTRWDCAWHDIWCEGDGLQLLHGKLICRYFPMVRRQGAWMLPRIAKRVAPGLIGAPRRRAA